MKFFVCSGGRNFPSRTTKLSTGLPRSELCSTSGVNLISVILNLSECRELNPDRIHPKDVYYHCTTLRGLSDTPRSYFFFPIALIHFVQARILFPLNFFRAAFLISTGTRTHCKLGRFLYFLVGLNFPRSLINLQAITDFFPQIRHCFSIVF